MVGVFAEVDAHGRVFVTDAAHLFVAGVGRFEVVSLESQVEFVVPEVVGLLAVPEPGQLQLVGAVPVLEVDDDETAVRRGDPPDLRHIEGVSVERKTPLQVEHVEVVVDHGEFHFLLPFLLL